MPEWVPVVISIEDARKCLGGISRTKFYATILPQLDILAKEMGLPNPTVKLGQRRMIRKEVLHRLIALGGYHTADGKQR